MHVVLHIEEYEIWNMKYNPCSWVYEEYLHLETIRAAVQFSADDGLKEELFRIFK